MGILIAAAIATVASLVCIGGAIVWRASPDDRRILVLLTLIQLPASPLVFYLVLAPVQWMEEQWIPDPLQRGLVPMILRAVLEELVKLWPLLLPSVWRSMTPNKTILRAMALGLGFGIGELWLNAEIVFMNMPEVANQPLLNLTGFINERLMVCAIHGVQTAVAMQNLIWGVPLAIGLHAVGNLPFYLQRISAFGLAAQTWTALIRAWVLWYFFALMFLLWTMSGGDLHLVWLLFGDATCPYCGMIYPRATLTWGLRVIHHDHCPRCKSRNTMPRQ